MNALPSSQGTWTLISFKVALAGSLIRCKTSLIGNIVAHQILIELPGSVCDTCIVKQLPNDPQYHWSRVFDKLMAYDCQRLSYGTVLTTYDKWWLGFDVLQGLMIAGNGTGQDPIAYPAGMHFLDFTEDAGGTAE